MSWLEDYKRKTGFMANNDKYPEPYEWERIKKVFSQGNDTPVLILRSCLWFYIDQKTNLEELRKFFSEKGITSLKSDGFIKIIE